MYFSKSTNGFYLLEVHGDNMPLDVVEISSEVYYELLKGQSKGQLIQSDENGFPILVDQKNEDISYKELRAREYPSICDYIDGVVKGDQDQINSYILACINVKTKYPKPV